jgi:hypothetical protein
MQVRFHLQQSSNIEFESRSVVRSIVYRMNPSFYRNLNACRNGRNCYSSANCGNSSHNLLMSLGWRLEISNNILIMLGPDNSELEKLLKLFHFDFQTFPSLSVITKIATSLGLQVDSRENPRSVEFWALEVNQASR